jgi:hypothetical protein
MAAAFKIIVNGSEVALPPITYGVVKANKEVIDKFTTADRDYNQVVADAVALLKLSAPDVDFDGATPIDILNASRDVHAATFYRPEGHAPVPQNP